MRYNSSTDLFEDFGGEYDEMIDGNILQTLSRSLMKKSFNILVTSNLEKRMSEKYLAEMILENHKQSTELIMDSQ